MDLCQEISCFRLASGKKQIIYILTKHIGDNFGHYPKILNAIFAVTVKPATVLPHQALSCNNRNKTKVYDCRPLYSIGFDRTRIAWEWYCVKWDQSYQGKDSFYKAFEKSYSVTLFTLLRDIR